MFERFPKLNFPDYDHEFSKKNDQIYVKDPIRKKSLILTPEEWVRQNAIQYLNNEQGFSFSSISVEGKVEINRMNKRYDILAFKQAKPFLLVECKAADINIDQGVFDQIARYNMTLNVPYLWVTNGLNHFFAQIDYMKQEYHFLKEFPS